ncbi:MAG: hypothetical protein AAF706_00535 [Bacteroidota bacterium]
MLHVKNLFGPLLILTCFTGACNGPHIPTRSHVENTEESMPSKRKAVILLHGLWSDASCLHKTEHNLRARLTDDIELCSLTERATSAISISEQAARLRSMLLTRGMQRQRYQLIFLGQSQGGLRAYAFWQQFSSEFDIRGLITVGTPWQGAPAATLTKHKVKAWLNSTIGHCLLHLVSYYYPNVTQDLTPTWVDTHFDRYLPTHEPGVQDLAPNSLFLRHVTGSLSESQLPILATGGTNGDVYKVLPENNAYTGYLRRLPTSALNAAYAQLIIGGVWEKHDMMVPLSSQLALGTSTGPDFETCVIPDGIHDLLPGLSINEDQVAYNHPVFLEQAVRFIGSRF